MKEICEWVIMVKKGKQIADCLDILDVIQR